MRISDWSSDVCSSDLEDIIRQPGEDGEEPPPPPKLQSSAKPGGVVALSWDVVDDADGYEIWATKDLAMGFGGAPLATVEAGTAVDVPELLAAEEEGEAIYQVVSVLPSGTRAQTNLEDRKRTRLNS